jgi:hypothetical protein
MTNFRITDAALVPDELWIESVLEPKTTWKPDEAKIRVALDQPCERCDGFGQILAACQRSSKPCVCHGSGLRQIEGVERVNE